MERRSRSTYWKGIYRPQGKDIGNWGLGPRPKGQSEASQPVSVVVEFVVIRIVSRSLGHVVVDLIHTVKQQGAGIDPRLRTLIEDTIGVGVRDYERFNVFVVLVHEFIGVVASRPLGRIES
jgi:hypothetical protein